ncbi:SGNH hydrolase domain-containing protein [Aeromicrobium sp. IC_218]|uniref:SGNH hydrolase domain-containing protein n=1 Tax=Aeromicrobium sp. IC_218 TaxID=2545468 RepID=UPI00103C1464|nr:SGNH hydrolase domain-containing protein [Aeromicrobium sp. IC_218]TCI97371.1 hypothetical protein E0W78_12415 [Aeromicrobium sp. IC_218]
MTARRRTGLLVAALALTLVAACSGAQDGDDEPTRPADGSGSSLTPNPARAEQDQIEYADGQDCHQRKGRSEVLACEFGDPKGSVHVVLAGDSKTEQWVDAFDAIGKERGWRVTSITKSACAFTAAELGSPDDEVNTSCEQWNTRARQVIEQLRPDAVFTELYKLRVPKAGRDIDGDEQHALMVQGLEDAYGELAARGIGTVLLDAGPRSDEDVPECVLEHGDDTDECDITEDEYDDPQLRFPTASAEQVVDAVGRARLVSINDVVCGEDGPPCAVVSDGVLRFRDSHHFTRTYTLQLAEPLGERVATALTELAAG